MPDTFRDFQRAIEGSPCLGLVAQAYGYQGELVSPASVLYLAFAHERWARFGIDCGDFHWRDTASLEPILGDGSGHTYPLVDLSTTYPIVGRRMTAVAFTRETPERVALTISFEHGGILAVVNQDDQSHLEYLAPAV